MAADRLQTARLMTSFARGWRLEEGQLITFIFTFNLNVY